MARFDTSFDATSVEPTTTYELLPAGKYRAQIVESEMRVTRNGMGQFLWLMLDILEGEHKGRKIFDQLNLVNPNPTTVEIAQRTLSAICHATGKMHVSDSEELHLIPMTIQVKIKPPKNGYGESNAIAYAHLCAAAGGVDAFLVGTEMPGLTTIRSGASTYPAVQAYRGLLGDVRAILGSGTKIGYAADWSEYFGHQPGDGSGDVFFHLDPLWADPEIDFIGIDNYMPLSDWRDGFEHADAAEGWPAIYDRGYLQANIAGGEGFDWFYASAADRTAQTRTPITDGAAGKPWVFRYKDLRAWWANPHVNRPGGVESGAPTAWVPQSKPIWFTELGCPAIDRGTNQPNVFFDPKSSESFTPHFSRGWRDDAIQRAYLEATWLWWGTPANNPVSSVYGGRMVHVPECAAWTWDARPYPFFPALTDVWTDGANWRLGHWLTGRLGAVSLAALVRHLCLRTSMPEALIDVSGLWGAVEGYAITALESPRASITTLSRHFGFTPPRACRT